jgi:anaerobic magnesium-protoporphyrin IX monomethyl ester cyclase
VQHRLLLVHPYIPAKFNGAPLGLLYLAATARAAGHEVRVVDLQAEPDTARFVDAMRQWRPTVLGLSSTSPSFKAAVRLAEAAKRIDPAVIVVKGGVHEAYCSQYTIAQVPEIDYCMSGEADDAFPLLLDSLPELDDLAHVPGLTWRTGDTPVANRVRSDPVDLDRLPYPARDLLTTSDYYDFSVFGGRRTTQVQTMRGCPFPCKFCNQRSRNPSVRAIEMVVEELRHLREAGYRAVFFDDPTFTVNRGRTEALVVAIRDAGLGMAFGCQTRSELVSPQLLEAMAEAGFEYVSFGLETTNEQSLLAFAKTRSQTRHLQAARDATSWCRSAGIRSCLTLIVGFPGETDASVEHTFTTAAELDPDFVSLSALALYPHEDRTVAAEYHRGVSEEPVWCDFDEGYGAIHPHLTEARAAELLETAAAILGPKLNMLGDRSGPERGPVVTSPGRPAAGTTPGR